MHTVTTRSVRRVKQMALGEILGKKRGERRPQPLATKKHTKARTK